MGASTAWHLAREGVDVRVVEKEDGPARHQSGRNSGVIHPGFNYDPDSTRAGFATEGADRLKAYCRERDVDVAVDGILVVARGEEEAATLEELKRRADANGVEADLVDGEQVQAIEPHARGVRGLHAPGGGSVDSKGYVEALVEDAEAEGVDFEFGTTVEGIDDPLERPGGPDAVRVRTDRGTLEAEVAVNCAGLHADRLAGVEDVRVIPFRGYYAELKVGRRDLVRSHVYPSPDLDFPFLGVHLSRRTDGRVIVGPGAMLAFGREAYKLHQVDPRDLLDVVSWPGFWKLFGDAKFRGLVGSEVEKSLRLEAVAEEARRLVPDVGPEDLVRSYAGNRAQLVDRDGHLIKDMRVRETARVVHVLNAVSPGLTASLPFGDHVAGRAADKL